MTTEAFVTRIWNEVMVKRLQEEKLRPLSYTESLIPESHIPVCQDSEDAKSKDYGSEYSGVSCSVHSGMEYSEFEFSLPDYGHIRGWLEDKDVTGWNTGIERRSAARITHEFLKRELKEQDENDWKGAEQLKDIYDCHTCVNHVAQVYAKGIMESVDGHDVFGMRRELTEQEAELIILRIFSKEKRKPPRTFDREKRKEPGKSHIECRKAVGLSKEEVLRRFSEERQAVLVDVRTEAEYEEGHLPGAICVTMADVLRNPKCITEDYRMPLFFYCGQGYQSEVAANCVAEAGYERVFYFGLV